MTATTTSHHCNDNKLLAFYRLGNKCFRNNYIPHLYGELALFKNRQLFTISRRSSIDAANEMKDCIFAAL